MADHLENLILKTMRQILGEDRARSIGFLMRIFAAPGGNEAATKKRISKEILKSKSGELFLQLSNGLSDLFTSGGPDRNQKEMLVAALAAARTKALSVPDELMVQMIDGVDIELLCAPTAAKNADLRQRAEQRVSST